MSRSISNALTNAILFGGSSPFTNTSTDHGWLVPAYFGTPNAFNRSSTVTAGSEDGRDFPNWDGCASTPVDYLPVSFKVTVEKARTPRGIMLTTGNGNHARNVQRAIMSGKPYPTVHVHRDPTGYSSKQKSRPNRPAGWYVFVGDIGPAVRECGGFEPADVSEGAAVWTWAKRKGLTSASSEFYPKHHPNAGERAPVGTGFYRCLRMNVSGSEYLFFEGADDTPPADLRAYVLAELADMPRIPR
jgi:hypothetical protein